MVDDFYSILEISKDASEQDIKKAYRKLNLQYHPDRNKSPDAEKKIRQINEAYETLGDPKKRQMYDNEAKGGFPFPSGGGADINNIFNMFFNGGGIPGMPGFSNNGIHIFHNGMSQCMKPQPMQQIAVISLEQAFQGCSVDLKINRVIVSGNSRTKESETIKVPIHQGFDNEVFVLEGKGNIVENCKGDVHVIIKIENNTHFKRQNMDLIYNKTLTLKEALCGFYFEITTLDGKIIKISNLEENNIIHPHHKMIMPKMGMKKEGNRTGNLIIEFAIEFPTTLSLTQRDSLNKIL